MFSPESEPLVVAFVADLMFSARIESVCERTGFRLRLIGRIHEITDMSRPAPVRQLAEHLAGPGADVLDQLTLWQPALLVFDLNNAAIPWREWIALIKSVPATRRIPVVCFGSHIDVDSLKAAQSAGAEAAVARSRFVEALPEILIKYARLPDYAGLEIACKEALSALAVRGLEEFNRGQYFLAHETLEEAWNEDHSAAKELYRAILQVAVAYLQIERGNYRGAMKMFLRVRQWLGPLPAICRGVDIEKLRTDASRVEAALRSSDPEKIQHFERTLFQPVAFVYPDES